MQAEASYQDFRGLTLTGSLLCPNLAQDSQLNLALDNKLKIEPPRSRKQNQSQLLLPRSAADAPNLTVPSVTSKKIGKDPGIGDS